MNAWDSHRLTPSIPSPSHLKYWTRQKTRLFKGMELHLPKGTINAVGFFHLEKRQMRAMLESCTVTNSVGKRKFKSSLFLVT